MKPNLFKFKMVGCSQRTYLFPVPYFLGTIWIIKDVKDGSQIPIHNKGGFAHFIIIYLSYAVRVSLYQFENSCSTRINKYKTTESMQNLNSQKRT